MKKIKIAQIGIGHDHASSVYLQLIKMSDLFEFVGYAEVPEDQLENEWMRCRLNNECPIYKDAKKLTVEEIFSMPDLDAVAIETYDLNLVKYAQMAADRGLNIMMDKAPGQDHVAFEKLLSTVKRKRLAFNIGYMYRFNPVIIDAFSKVKQGEFGKIHSVETEMSCYYDVGKRDWLGFFKGGMMQYLGCHLVDLVVRLLGVPDEILPLNSCTGYKGTTAEDLGLAILKYPNGVSTVKSVMGDHGGYVRRHFVINGEHGSFEIRPLEKYSPNGLHAITTHATFYNSLDWHNLGQKQDTKPFSRYESMLTNFAKMVRGETGYAVDLETEALVHRCLLACCGIDCDYKGKITLD